MFVAINAARQLRRRLIAEGDIAMTDPLPKRDSLPGSLPKLKP